MLCVQPEGSAHWALQAADPTFNRHGLSGYRTGRESGNVSLQRRRRKTVRGASCVPLTCDKGGENTRASWLLFASEHLQAVLAGNSGADRSCLSKSQGILTEYLLPAKHSTGSWRQRPGQPRPPGAQSLQFSHTQNTSGFKATCIEHIPVT